MKLLIGAGLGIAAAAVVAFLLFGMPITREVWCDGAYPVWMLEEQDWDGSSCVEVYPSDQAPPGADWRLYCTGLCDPGSNPSEVSFPQSAGDR